MPTRRRIELAGLVAAAVVSAVTLCGACILMPFEWAAADAALVLHVRCVSAVHGTVRLAVIDSLKGKPGARLITITRSDWFCNPLTESRDYIVLLNSESQPYVGDTLGKPGRGERLPADTCGTPNVAEIRDGKLRIDGYAATTVKGQELTYDSLKAQLSKGR